MTISRPPKPPPAPATSRATRPVMTDGYEIDSDFVVYRLEEAGRRCLPCRAPATRRAYGPRRWKSCGPPLNPHGWTEARIRPAVPSAGKITRMDEAMSSIPLIPVDRYVLRRVVGARSLVHPITDRHLFPWRRLGKALGADHKAVQRWHAQGIAMIVAALNAA